MKAIIGATIHPVSSPPIPDGVLLFEEQIIKQVGSRDQVQIPSDAEIIELPGKHIFPGFIDPHTHVGIDEEGVGKEGDDYNETSEPVTPYLRAIDGIYPQDKGFEDALKGGITTVGITPGSANVIGGEIAALHTYGRTVEEKLIRAPVGMKFATGENPKRIHGSKRSPATRMAVAYLIRQALYKAIDYANKWSIHNQKAEAGDPTSPPETDLGLENLMKVVDTSIKARFHAHRIDDIMTAVRIAEEFGLDYTIDHATEAHLIPDVLASRDVYCVVGPIISNRSKVELKNRTAKTAAVLEQHNVKFAIATDHPVLPIQYLRTSIGIAISKGLSFETALKANTIVAAKILGISDLVGTIEAGKFANFVAYDSPNPFAIETSVVQVYVEGIRALDNS